MIEDTSRAFIGLFLWSIVPGFFANLVLGQYYKLKFPDARNRPKKGTPKFRKNYIQAYMLVMMAYFAYCVGQAIYDLPQNYYQRLAISRPAVERELKPRYRSLVMQLHPDKAPNADPQLFLEVKNMYENLENAGVRTAYEIYGEAVLNAAESSSKKSNRRPSPKEFFDTAFMRWGIFHGGSICVLLLMAGLSKGGGAYWRLTGLLLSASVELYALTRPSAVLALDRWVGSFGLNRLLGQFTIHEKVTVFKSIVVNLAIVITQLISINKDPVRPVNEEILEVAKQLDELTSGSLQGIADDEAAVVAEVLDKDPALATRFNGSISKLLSELESK